MVEVPSQWGEVMANVPPQQGEVLAEAPPSILQEMSFQVTGLPDDIPSFTDLPLVLAHDENTGHQNETTASDLNSMLSITTASQIPGLSWNAPVEERLLPAPTTVSTAEKSQVRKSNVIDSLHHKKCFKANSCEQKTGKRNGGTEKKAEKGSCLIGQGTDVHNYERVEENQTRINPVIMNIHYYFQYLWMPITVWLFR